MDPLSLIRSVRSPTPVDQLEIDGVGEVLAKREDLGPNQTFKWRGALCACRFFQEGGAEAVVTASTGNHGAAVAWAAQRLGLAAHVFVPSNAVEDKCRIIEGHGALLHRVGADLHACAQAAEELAEREGLAYFEDGGVAAQLGGTATVGEELLEVDGVGSLFIPVACGALAAGIGTALRRGPGNGGPKLIGVQARAFSRLTARFHGEPYAPTGGTTIADGLADDRLIEPALSACLSHLDEMVVVEEEEIEAAISLLWRTAGIKIEGASGASLAALLGYSGALPPGLPMVVLTGANLDAALAERLLEGEPGQRQTSPRA